MNKLESAIRTVREICGGDEKFFAAEDFSEVYFDSSLDEQFAIIMNAVGNGTLVPVDDSGCSYEAELGELLNITLSEDEKCWKFYGHEYKHFLDAASDAIDLMIAQIKVLQFENSRLEEELSRLMTEPNYHLNKGKKGSYK
jgi:hypothetical protein